MPPPLTQPTTVAQFAKSMGCDEAVIWYLVKEGLLLTIDSGERMLIDPKTQRKRYYYYQMLSSRGAGVNLTHDEMRRTLDRMDAENAPVSHVIHIKTAEDLKRVNGKINGKVLKGQPEREDPISEVENSVLSMAQAKLQKEQANARKAELEAAELEGKMVRKDQVERLWADIGIRIQKAILTIPDRLAPVIACENDGRKIHKMMTDELKYALRNLSEEVQELDTKKGRK